MHVVEITYSWPAETFIVRHAEAVSAVDGVGLTIAAKAPVPPESSSIQSASANGYRVTALPNFDHLGVVAKLSLAARSVVARLPDSVQTRNVRARVLMDALVSLRPDLVHFHFGTLAVLMADTVKSLRVPYTVSLRGSDIQVAPLANSRYAERLGKTLQGASGIHTVCESFALEAKNFAAGIPDPVAIRTCVPIPDKTPSLRSPSDKPRLVSVGRLHWRKAYHDLVRAMLYLPSVELDIIGDGPEREHLLYLIHSLGLSSRVRLLGSMPYAEFVEHVASASAFVQSSVAEGFSNALAEAMALGKPVFATPVGGTEEVVIDGENGIVLPVGDPAGAAERLTKVHDSALMGKLGVAARETAERRFSSSRHAQRFAEFFQAALR